MIFTLSMTQAIYFLFFFLFDIVPSTFHQPNMKYLSYIKTHVAYLHNADFVWLYCRCLPSLKMDFALNRIWMEKDIAFLFLLVIRILCQHQFIDQQLKISSRVKMVKLNLRIFYMMLRLCPSGLVWYRSEAAFLSYVIIIFHFPFGI